MLTIRNVQLEAMAARALLEFRQELVDLLRFKYAELRDLPRAYVESLAQVGLDACREHGFEHEGSVIDFAEALVKNDAHPLTPEALTRKAATVLQDLRARELFLRLQGVRASLAPPDHDDGGGHPVPHPIEE